MLASTLSDSIQQPNYRKEPPCRRVPAPDLGCGPRPRDRHRPLEEGGLIPRIPRPFDVEVQVGPVISYGQHVLPLAGERGIVSPGANSPPRALIGKLSLILPQVVEHEEIEVLVIRNLAIGLP